MKLIVNENSGAALNATLLYEYLNKKLNQPAKLSMAKGEKLCLEVDGNNNKLESIQSISRHLATSLDKTLTGSNALELAEVDSWLDFAQALVNAKTEAAFNELAKIMETALTNKQYLVGNRLTIADISILSSLKFNNDLYQKYLTVNKNNLIRYSAGMEKALQNVSANKVKSSEPKDYSKEGKFIDLPDAVKGKVVVRFPPEASGFLHIGHAKAALLNQFYQLEFEGKLIFRFDDTNPAKENALYEKVIEEDVKLLGITWDQFSRTSDYFDLLSDYCEQMIREGKAYVDDTEAALMKEEREQKKDSVNRANSIEKNLKIWEEMKKGTENGLRYCVRAMLNMQSPNGTMRDPTIYRCKAEPHLVTGDKYKVYPTYDFACPIVDSIEHVTHALRTTEYHDRDEQYYWMCDALNLRKPFIYEYSRFNLTNTVLSKRRLTWFVDTKRVTGWDDPRFPTVRGILRRGMSVEALKQFIIAQGSSRSVVVMEWDKIWAINKKVIDEVAPRHTALLKENRVVVNVKGQNGEEVKDMPRHPKNAKLGTKKVCYSSKIMIDEADALTVKENDTVTFMDWGNMKIKKINKSGDKITSIDAELDLDNKDYKKTLKLTWLACAPTLAPFTPVRCIHYDHIIAKAILDKDEDFKNYCEHQTEFPFDVLGDHEMRNLKKGDTIQVSRRGYYICDKAFTPAVAGKETSKDGVWEGEACVLLYIPEGNKTENPTTYMSITKQVYPSVKFALENVKTKEKTPTPAVQVGAVSSQSGDLDAKITKQGDLIRDMKTKKASKDDITKEVQTLLALKTEYKTLTGQEWKPNTAAAGSSTPAPAAPRAEKPKKEKVPQPVKDDGKKQTRLGLEAKKEENLPEWYTQIITKGDLIEYYDVSGCYILRPWSYFIWDQIKDFFDKRIKAMGVHNCYFPIFVSKAALEREKDHIADFAPEVAWVTKSGQSDLAEPIAIRPTSETVMYPSYARWIQSHRDLPMKMNQWNNVVRWEFKHPQPFLRTREFLWQEGHTAFATREEATEEVYEILDHYADIYSDLLAVPVVKGQKTEKEKFAGADFTTTVEAFIAASGRAIQGGTSHHLGQNFSKMFNIEFADPVTNEKTWVHQNSWGLTTRTIGVLVMVHSDNIGLVLPPKVALYQVVIVPCGVTASLSKEDEEKLYEKCKEYEKTLKKAGIRAHYDNRHNYSPGWKFNSWELKGVPIRIELGPKDIAANKYCAVRRDLMKKEFYEEAGLVATTEKMMVDMHADMLKKAEAELESNIAVVDTWTEFLKNLDAKKIIMVPFCLGKDCEEVVKKDSARDAVVEEGAPSMGAKSLCIPFKQPREITTQKCFNPSCGKPAIKYTLFGRSY